MLGRQRIIDSDHREATRRRQFAHQPVVGVDREEGEAAAVEIDKRRRGRRRAHGAMDAQAQFARVGIEAQLVARRHRSEEHTSELQSLMRISYAVFCLKTKKTYI